MEETTKVQGKRKRTRPPRGAARRARSAHPHSHPFEVRRKAVQLCLEESFPLQRVAREMGVGLSTLSKWVRAYREQGEAGLQPQPPRGGRRRTKVAAAVKTHVVELKRRHPDFGIQKISQFLRRMLFLPVSRETVRRTLHEQQLLPKRKPKPQRNPPKPRFFERATPNQMWQADIFFVPLNSPPHYPPYHGGMGCAVREVKTPLVEKILAGRTLTASQVQIWAEVLAHELNHHSRPCLEGKVACEVFHQAKAALRVFTLRKRKETLDWINELTSLLIRAWDVCTPRQA